MQYLNSGECATIKKGYMGVSGCRASNKYMPTWTSHSSLPEPDHPGKREACWSPSWKYKNYDICTRSIDMGRRTPILTMRELRSVLFDRLLRKAAYGML